MGKQFTKEQIANVMADYDKGLSTKELTAKHNMSPTTFLAYRRKMGLELRRDPVVIASLLSNGMKKCGGKKLGCGKVLPVSSFHKDASYCRPCSREICKKFYHSENGEACWREYRYQKVFGISLGEYEGMLKQQHGRCALCLAIPQCDQKSRLHVDHCHATGKIRGLLCSKCNTGIGLLQDSPELMRRAAEYVETNGQVTIRLT